SGMETSLVLLAMTMALTAALSSAFWLGAAIGLLGLLRADALLFGAVLLGFRAVWTRRVPWREALVAATCLAPWYLFAWAYYGSPLPNSIPAKVAAYNDHMPSFGPALRTVWAHIGPYRNGFGAEGFKWVAFPLSLLGLVRLRAHPRLAVLPVYLALYLSFLVL